MEPTADIGVIGLAVMGQNLALNMIDHGYKVAVFTRTVDKVDAFLTGPGEGTQVVGSHTLKELVGLLKPPRRVMLMIKAGKPVDEMIEQLLPLLEGGDIIIDGGNSLFSDTERREKYVRTKGLFYIGTGVSGGEEGARHGPSIMPGGSPEAWPAVKDIFQNIAAKAPDGTACCDWVGQGGAGHYVKMIHNGIEYGDLQVIAEAYNLLRNYADLNTDDIAKIFDEWNRGELNSYLIEITAAILAHKDSDGSPLVDKILDSAGQKGTGKWTVINSAELGQPVTLIAEAVYARVVSALREERLVASDKLKGPNSKLAGDKAEFIDKVRQAIYASKIVSYTQGYMLMRAAAAQYSWNLNYGGIAQMWRGGCIIRSVFLENIMQAFDKNRELTNLLLDDFFTDATSQRQDAWRDVISQAVKAGLPVPAFSSALSFYDGYRSKQLPANLIQAQRDYFGAHTYERIDHQRGEFFHTNWTGQGGETSSSSYNA
jgi:6-phosphogluconate dehydrogenase